MVHWQLIAHLLDHLRSEDSALTAYLCRTLHFRLIHLEHLECSIALESIKMAFKYLELKLISPI